MAGLIMRHHALFNLNWIWCNKRTNVLFINYI